MISADDLIALVRNYNPKTNEALIRSAYEFGAEMHDGQLRGGVASHILAIQSRLPRS